MVDTRTVDRFELAAPVVVNNGADRSVTVLRPVVTLAADALPLLPLVLDTAEDPDALARLASSNTVKRLVDFDESFAAVVVGVVSALMPQNTKRTITKS